MKVSNIYNSISEDERFQACRRILRVFLSSGGSTENDIKTTKQDIWKDAVYTRSLDKKDSLSMETQMEKGLVLSDENAEVYKGKGYSGKNTERYKFCRLCRRISTCGLDEQHKICYIDNSQ